MQFFIQTKKRLIEIGVKPKSSWGRPHKSWPCFAFGKIGIWWYNGRRI